MMGTLGGVSCALGTRHPPCRPRASRGLAKPSRAVAEARRVAAEGREVQGGWVWFLVPTEARAKPEGWAGAGEVRRVGGHSPAPPTRMMGTLRGHEAAGWPRPRSGRGGRARGRERGERGRWWEVQVPMSPKGEARPVKAAGSASRDGERVGARLELASKAGLARSLELEERVRHRDGIAQRRHA